MSRVALPAGKWQSCPQAFAIWQGREYPSNGNHLRQGEPLQWQSCPPPRSAMHDRNGSMPQQAPGFLPLPNSTRWVCCAVHERTADPPGHSWRDKWTALSGPLSVHTRQRWRGNGPGLANLRIPGSDNLVFCNHMQNISMWHCYLRILVYLVINDSG